MRATAGHAVLVAIATALAACETTTDVVLGKGQEADGGGGLPAGGVRGVSEATPTGGAGGAGGVGTSAAAGSGGIMDFPVASGGGRAGCASSVQPERELIARDVVVLFDQSASMDDPLPAPASGTWWQAAQQAFARFVNDPALSGHRVGLQFFPLGGVAPASCTADYGALAVPVAALPANASPLLAAMQGRTPVGFTPLGPALAGVIAHLAQPSSGSPIVLVVTDGFPTECQPMDIAGVAAIAKSGFESAQFVSTHVVGLNLGTAGENLHAIAQAGGSGKATLIAAGPALVEELYAAMRSVLRAPIPCRWLMPTPPGASAPTPKTTSIYFRPPQSTEPQFIPYVDSGDQCELAGGGWYLQPQLEHSDQFVVLCPQSCAAVQDSVEVVMTFGCGGPIWQ